MEWNERYIIRDWEGGNNIDAYDTLEEARAKVDEFIEDDKKDGIYKPGFYEIYDQVEDEIERVF